MWSHKTATRFTGLAATSLLILSCIGCSADDSGESGTSTDTEEATDLSSSMVACLKGEGLEARVSDSSRQVMVHTDAGLVIEDSGENPMKTTTTSEKDGLTAGPLTVEDFDTGTGLAWVSFRSSADISDDPDLQQAYESCEAKLPDFQQPDFTFEDTPEGAEQMADMQESALAFTKCARSEGFSWVEDPQEGVVRIPDGTSVEDVRSTINSCYKANEVFRWEASDKIDLADILRDLPMPSHTGTGSHEE